MLVIHEVVEQGPAPRIAAVGVKSFVPRFMPESVRLEPPERGALSGLSSVGTGASKEKVWRCVPTTVVTVTKNLIDRVPLPSEVRHRADVTDAHVVVSQVMLDRQMVGVVSRWAKLNPCSVMLFPPLATELYLARNDTVGASKENTVCTVPTNELIVVVTARFTP